MLTDQVSILDAENKSLREIISKLQLEVRSSKHTVTVLHENITSLNKQWSEKFTVEKERTSELSKQNAQLSSEFTEAVDINNQLTHTISDIRDMLQKEIEGKQEAELCKDKALSEIAHIRKENADLEEKYFHACESSLTVAKDAENLRSSLKKMNDELQQLSSLKVTHESMDLLFQADLRSAFEEIKSRDVTINTLEVRLRTIEDWAGSLHKLLSQGDIFGSLNDKFPEIDKHNFCLIYEVGLQMKKKLESYNLSWNEKDMLTKAFHEKIDLSEKSCFDLKKELSHVAERNAFLEETVAQLNRQIETMENCSAQMLVERIKHESCIEDLEKQMSKLSDELNNQKQDNISLEKVSRVNAELKSENTTLRDEVAALKSQIDEKEKQGRSYFEQMKLTKMEFRSSIDELQCLRNSLVNKELEIRDLNDALSKVELEKISAVSAIDKSNKEKETLIFSQKKEIDSLMESNGRLTEGMMECQTIFSATRESLTKQIAAKAIECEEKNKQLDGFAKELAAALKEISAAKDLIEIHKGVAETLKKGEESNRVKIKAQETTITALRRDIENLKKQLDSTVLQLSQLENSSSKREEDRRILQIEVLQLRNQIKVEQEEVRTVTEMHQSMREAFERRAQQNQEVVNAADSRAVALEGELSEVISKYNTLAQTHKELRQRYQQLSATNEELRSSHINDQSETLMRQRRLMYELNLRLAEQETLVRDLTSANTALHTSLSRLQGSHRSHLTFQPLNTVEGPIRHPKKLRVEQFSSNVNSK